MGSRAGPPLVVRRPRIARSARRAGRASTAASSQEIVVGAGVDELMGLAARFCGAGRRRPHVARHLPDLRLSRDRLRRERCASRRIADGSRRLRGARRHRARAHGRAIVYLANPDNPSGRVRRPRRDRRVLRSALPRRRAAAARRSVRGFRRAGRSCFRSRHRRASRSGCARFRRPTGWPARASATRCAAAQRGDLSEDPAALRRQPQRADRRARRARRRGVRRDGRRARRARRAKSTTPWRASWACGTSSRTRTSCASRSARAGAPTR